MTIPVGPGTMERKSHRCPSTIACQVIKKNLVLSQSSQSKHLYIEKFLREMF